MLLAAVSSTAAAQGRKNDTAPGDDVPLEQIVVSGYRHSLAHAIETKRQSEQVMEALVAEDIGKLPDNNVAEALQRLTGINVGFTAGGEGGTAFIRGIQTSPGVSAVRVELNGNDMGSGGRNASISNVPASPVSSIQVFKSPAADHVEGGLAGTIRLITHDPARLPGPTASASVRGTYYDFGKDFSPFGRAGESVGSAGKPNADDAILFPGNLYNDSETRDIERGFVNAAFSFEPSRDLKLSFEATHRFDTTLRNRDELRILSPFNKTNEPADFRFTQHAGVTMYDADSGDFVPVPSFVSGTLNNIPTRSVSRADLTELKSLNLVAKVDWHAGNRDIEFRLGSISGTTDVLSNNAQFDSATNTGGAFSPDVFFDFAAGTRMPTVRFANFDPTDPSSWRLRQVGRDSRMDDAQKNVVSIDLDYHFDGDFFRSIEFGYRFNEQSLDRQRRNENLTAGLPGRNDSITNFAGLYDGAYSGSGRHLRRFRGDIPRNWVTPIVPVGVPTSWIKSFGSDANTNSRQFANPPLSLGGSYNIEESIHAGYLMTRIGHRGDRSTGNVGARVVNTKTISDGFRTRPDGQLTPFRVTNSYTEVLPSLNLGIHLNDELLLRIAAFRTMVRPFLGRLRSNQALTFDANDELSGGAGAGRSERAARAHSADHAGQCTGPSQDEGLRGSLPAPLRFPARLVERLRHVGELHGRRVGYRKRSEDAIQ